MGFFPVSLPANPVLMPPAFQIFSLHNSMLLCHKRASTQFCILQAHKYQDLRLPDEVEERRSFTFPFQNMPFYSLHCIQSTTDDLLEWRPPTYVIAVIGAQGGVNHSCVN